MKINIKQKYIANVDNKFNGENRDLYNKEYTSKQRSMWFFTLMLLKKDPERIIYDSENEMDLSWLELSMNVLSHMPDVEKFTIEEWFNFLNGQTD